MSNNHADAAERLRTLRLSLSLTLAELSRRTDLPISTLSKLENGKMSLTYDKLVKLSVGLGLSLAQLLLSEPPPHLAGSVASSSANSLGRRSITRACEMASLDTPPHFRQELAADLLNKSMAPVIMDINNRLVDGEPELSRHPGEEFILVLEGEILFICELYAPAILKTGDSVYFDSGMGHAYVRNTDARSRLLSICSIRT